LAHQNFGVAPLYGMCILIHWTLRVNNEMRLRHTQLRINVTSSLMLKLTLLLWYIRFSLIKLQECKIERKIISKFCTFFSRKYCMLNDIPVYNCYNSFSSPPPCRKGECSCYTDPLRAFLSGDGYLYCVQWGTGL